MRSVPVRETFRAIEPKEEVAVSKRYGYTAVHRREASRYSTDLTDAEWALVADLFERSSGGRGAPALYERRHLVNACCYVLRTACAWRLLPSNFAPWQAVYKAFVRWVEAYAFEQMQDRLRQQWRTRMGRSAEPSAVVIDSTLARKSKAGNATSWWTRSGCCWLSR